LGLAGTGIRLLRHARSHSQPETGGGASAGPRRSGRSPTPRTIQSEQYWHQPRTSPNTVHFGILRLAAFLKALRLTLRQALRLRLRAGLRQQGRGIIAA
jgi:hypothetical protein